MRSLLLFIVLLVACESSEAPPEATRRAFARQTANEPDALGDDLLHAVNGLRAKGCHCPDKKWYAPAPALRWNDLLARSAQRHAQDMQRHNFFKHLGSDGSDFTDRIRATGYDWRVAAENMALGHTSVAEVVKSWETSEGHCQNLMHPELQEMGVAKVGKFWVQDFGTRK